MLVGLLRGVWVGFTILDTLRVLKTPRRKPQPDGSHVIARISPARREKMRKLMMMWIVWVAWEQLEYALDSSIGLFMPFYGQMKMSLLLYLCVTGTLGGELLYKLLLKPYLDRYSRTIDLSTQLIGLILQWALQLSLLVTVVPIVTAFRKARSLLWPTIPASSESPDSDLLRQPNPGLATPPRHPRTAGITQSLVEIGLSSPRSVKQAVRQARAIYGDLEERRKVVAGRERVGWGGNGGVRARSGLAGESSARESLSQRTQQRSETTRSDQPTQGDASRSKPVLLRKRSRVLETSFASQNASASSSTSAPTELGRRTAITAVNAQRALSHTPRTPRLPPISPYITSPTTQLPRRDRQSSVPPSPMLPGGFRFTYTQPLARRPATFETPLPAQTQRENARDSKSPPPMISGGFRFLQPTVPAGVPSSSRAGSDVPLEEIREEGGAAVVATKENENRRASRGIVSGTSNKDEAMLSGSTTQSSKPISAPASAGTAALPPTRKRKDPPTERPVRSSKLASRTTPVTSNLPPRRRTASHSLTSMDVDDDEATRPAAKRARRAAEDLAAPSAPPRMVASRVRGSVTLSSGNLPSRQYLGGRTMGALAVGLIDGEGAKGLVKKGSGGTMKEQLPRSSGTSTGRQTAGLGGVVRPKVPTTNPPKPRGPRRPVTPPPAAEAQAKRPVVRGSSGDEVGAGESPRKKLAVEEGASADTDTGGIGEVAFTPRRSGRLRGGGGGRG